MKQAQKQWDGFLQSLREEDQLNESKELVLELGPNSTAFRNWEKIGETPAHFQMTLDWVKSQ